jgi:hypothetical protein
MYKVVASVAEALADVHDGASLAVGGFGLSGVPNASDQRTHKLGVSHLRVVSNNCGAMATGLAVLAGRRADRAGDRFLYRGEQGVRAPVPGRRAGSGADPAGHAGRAAARWRGGDPRFLHARGCRDAGRGGRAAVAVRRGLKAVGRESLARISATGVHAVDRSTSCSPPAKPSTAHWPRRAR